MAEHLGLDAQSWSKSLKNTPKVSVISIAKHLHGCGKKEIGQKGYKFFSENYIHNVFTKEVDGAICAKALCHRSQRKTEAPHKISVTINENKDKIAEFSVASCSCKAG